MVSIATQKMTSIAARLRTFVRENSGQDLLEYALLICLIALAAVVAVKAAGVQVAAIFTAITAAIPA